MKFEKGTIKHLILSIIMTDIFGLIIFPLFDWIFDSVFSKTKFSYSVRDHIIVPLIICTIVAIICWFLDKRKAKKK